MASQFDEPRRENDYDPQMAIPLIAVGLTALASLMLVLALVLWV